MLQESTRHPLEMGGPVCMLKAGAMGGSRHALQARGTPGDELNQALQSYRCNTLGFRWLTEELELAGYSAGSSMKVSN